VHTFFNRKLRNLFRSQRAVAQDPSPPFQFTGSSYCIAHWPRLLKRIFPLRANNSCEQLPSKDFQSLTCSASLFLNVIVATTFSNRLSSGHWCLEKLHFTHLDNLLAGFLARFVLSWCIGALDPNSPSGSIPRFL
jgi:hypothetical protein